MTETNQPQPKVVRRERVPLCWFVTGGAISGLCVWIERTFYDDGSVTEEYRDAKG